MRVVFDARHIRNFGIGTYIRNLLRSLLDVDSVNEYVLIGYRESRADLRALAKLSSRVSVTYFEGRDDTWQDHLAFPYFLRQHQGDVYHVPIAWVPFLMPRPYVVTVHDIGFLLFPETKNWRKQFRERLIGRGLRRASKVIAVSGATQRDVQHLFNIPPERLQLIYDAPDPALFPDQDENDPVEPNRMTHRKALLERFQIDSPFLLYAGSVRPQKNVPRLIEAFSVLRSELAKHPHYRRLKLLIIGDEISKNPAVRLAVLHSRLEDSVRFLGFVPDDTLRVFFEAAEAFVFPSLYEGFGLAPLEAMMARTPVVASNVSSLPEVLGDAAYLVNPENVFEISRGIHDVLLDAELRATLIQKGLLQARKYSWTETAKQVAEVYREAAEKKSS